MTWGPQIEFLQGVEKSTGVAPGALRERPKLAGTQGYYKDVFSDLASSRTYTAEGFACPILLSEVLAYCELFGIAGMEERDRLYRMVRAMDSAFCKVVSERVKSKLPSK